MSHRHHWRKRLRHAVHRAVQHLNPANHIRTVAHVAQRVAHYANPRVHLEALKRAANFTGRSVERQAHFVERQAKKDYIKFNRVTSYIAPVVTPVLAFVGELIPVVGLVLGPVISFAGAAIARVSTGVALRSKGVTGLENRQRSRGKQNRTLKYGLFGSALGGIASAFGLGLTSASATAATPANAASGAPTAAAPATTNAVTNVTAATTGASTTAAASSGILGTGITWSQIGSVLAPLLSVAPTLLKFLGIGQAKPAGQPAEGQVVGSGGGSGTEGTGNTGAEAGPLGALSSDLAGLPLPVKLGAVALGAGLVALAFQKGKKVA